MVGVEFAGPAADVVRGLRERGVLATRAGENVLRLLPPLVVKPKDIREFLGTLDAVLATGAGRAAEPAVRTGTGGAIA
jgi:acetylornithine/N-succinyldiaminopimelate aminotransferase